MKTPNRIMLLGKDLLRVAEKAGLGGEVPRAIMGPRVQRKARKKRMEEAYWMAANLGDHTLRQTKRAVMVSWRERRE